MVGRLAAVCGGSLHHTRSAVIDKESFYYCKLESIEQSNEKGDR